MNANGSFDPEDDYFGDYLIYDSSFLTAAPAGGLWILTRNGQARLDRNADPVFEARETPFAFNRILYFNPSQDTAPYNILYRCAQSPSVHTVNLAFLNEDGNAASDPERLFGMPVSTSFLDYVMFTDAAHFHEDLLVYGLHAGRPMTGSLLGVYDTFRDENTVLDSLRDGVTLDVHTDGENYYDVLYRMTSDPDTIHPVSGELIVCYTPLSTPEITEVVLVDTIRGRYFGSEDDGMLKSCDARAFFTDKLLYTLTLDSGLTWNVRQYTYEGEVLNGPINLPAEASDDVAAFLEAEPEGCWVVLGQKVYLLDNDLEFIEAYEQGIPFTTWENIEYENPHAVQLANRNLVVAGNAGNSLLMAQCFEGLEPGGGVDGDTKSIHPMTFELAAPWPNPFNSTTRLRYSLPHAGEVRLAVYDILGRQVRVLANATQQAGQYEVHWDGCTDAGIGVASGVYFVRDELGEQQLVRKVLLVK